MTIISNSITQEKLMEWFYPIVPISLTEDETFYRVQTRFANPRIVKKLSLLFSSQVSVERIPLEDRKSGARFVFIIPKENSDFLN